MDSAVTDVTVHTQPIGAAVSTTSASRVVLPIEVEEEIIKCLDSYRDRDTLTKCARVCKLWLPCCRHKLYEKITIHDNDRWKQFEQLLSHCPSGIKGYLEVTKVLGVDCIYPQDITGRKLLYKLLTTHAPRFPGLQSLHISGLIWNHPILSGDPISDTTHYQKLTSLQLKDCIFGDLLQLHEVISRLPALSSLSLHSTSFNSQTEFQPQDASSLSPAPRLSHISLTSSVAYIYPMSTWLVMSGMVQNLTSVKWRSYTPGQTDIAPLEWILRNAKGLESIICKNLGHMPFEGQSALFAITHLVISFLPRRLLSIPPPQAYPTAGHVFHWRFPENFEVFLDSTVLASSRKDQIRHRCVIYTVIPSRELGYIQGMRRHTLPLPILQFEKV